MICLLMRWSQDGHAKKDSSKIWFNAAVYVYQCSGHEGTHSHARCCQHVIKHCQNSNIMNLFHQTSKYSLVSKLLLCQNSKTYGILSKIDRF